MKRATPFQVHLSLPLKFLSALVLLSSCAKNESRPSEYHCPMHPTYIADQKGECPICNMDLTLRSAPAVNGELRGTPLDARSSDGQTRVDSVPGRAMVTLDPRGRQLANIQTAPATQETPTQEIRTRGIVVRDERRARRIHTRVDGYVEAVYIVNGDFVHQGDTILEFFSPEILALQQDFLRALEMQARLSSLPDLQRSALELRLAVLRKLELYEVPELTIARLEREHVIHRMLPLKAPISGFVITQEAVQGQHVMAGTELYTVTDLSRIWILADFYENEAGRVRVGQLATLSLPHGPHVFEARVAGIYPYVESATRTVKVRFEVPNPDLILKPGMFVDVRLSIDSKLTVVVPESAILYSWPRHVVFVEVQENSFEPRLVDVGVRFADKVEVLAGVRQGERVVVGSNFLLDSESRLRWQAIKHSPHTLPPSSR